KDADGDDEVEGAVREREARDVRLGDHDVGAPLEVPLRGLDGEAEVDADDVSAPAREHVREAPGPDPGVEHELARHLLAGEPGLLDQDLLRVVRARDGIELRRRVRVPFEAERAHVAVAPHEAGNAVDDRPSRAAGGDERLPFGPQGLTGLGTPEELTQLGLRHEAWAPLSPSPASTEYRYARPFARGSELSEAEK